MSRYLLIAAVTLAACQGKRDAPTGKAGSAEAARPKIEGPRVEPVITAGVTFVTPKATASWWGEVQFSCYRAVMGLSGTKTPGEAFEKLSPNVVPAMQAGGIDLGRDLAAIGAFDCGGSMCLYVAASLAQPDKLGEVLTRLRPASPPREVARHHYQLEAPGANGPRTIHIRAVPIEWSTAAPADAWSQEAARATHVVFISGIDGKQVDLDPLVSLADPRTARARVQEAEGAVADPRGRCALGLVGAQPFQPGFQLDKARFAIAAPEGKGDPLMQLLGSRRTLSVEVELVLSPVPTPADALGWIGEGRAWLGAIGDSVRASFAGQDELVEVYFDMLSLIGTRAFEHEVKDGSLRLSWRTDRVPATDLTTIENRLERLLPAAAP